MLPLDSILSSPCHDDLISSLVSTLRNDNPTDCSVCVDTDSPSVLQENSAPPVRIKRGFREMTSNLTCGIIFEADPVWLWALRPNSWRSIYISVSDRSVIMTRHLDLWTTLTPKLVTIPSTFYGDYPSVAPDIMFISGRLSFISNVTLPSTGIHLFWLSHAPRRFPTLISHISWTRIGHNKVGGVTDARATFGINVGNPVITLAPDLSRSLGHILKHSIRPRPCDVTISVDHYGRCWRSSVPVVPRETHPLLDAHVTFRVGI